jgi:alkanesulfonate monooxygenase SsuD/methylene tetrahydromethanopterin reductase-like flavin-dependent oxidoreductase (luciferase family)
MLAKLAATVDGISGGRLILALGAGWNEREYRAFGFPYDRRVSRFAEAFTIIRTLLAEGEIDFEGEFYRADNCILHPRGVQRGGPPLMVGSVRPRMLSITLPHVDSWNVWWSDFGNTSTGFAELKARVDRQVVESGRPAGSVSATCAVMIQLPGGGGRQMGAYGDAGDAPVEPIQGTPTEVAERIRAFADAGAAHVQLVVDPITRDSIEWFEAMFAVLDG